MTGNAAEAKESKLVKDILGRQAEQEAASKAGNIEVTGFNFKYRLVCFKKHVFRSLKIRTALLVKAVLELNLAVCERLVLFST